MFTVVQRIMFVVIVSLSLALLVALVLVSQGQAANPQYEVWVPNQANDQVAIVQPETWQVLATVDVNTGTTFKSAKPHIVTFSPSSKYAYVANVGAVANTNNVTVIRTSDRKVVAQIPTARTAHTAMPSNNGKRVWVLNTEVHLITEITADEGAETWAISRTIELRTRPILVAFTANDAYAYVTLGGDNQNFGAVAVLDVASGKVVKTLETGRAALAAVLSRDRSRIFANVGFHMLNAPDMNERWFVFNPRDHSLVRQGALSGVKDSHAMLETVDGKELWMINRQSNTVTVLDPMTGAVKTVIPVGDRPDMLDFSPDGKYAFWTTRGQPQTGDPFALKGLTPGVEVYDVATRKLAAFIPMPQGDPHGVAVLVTTPPTAPQPALLPVTGDRNPLWSVLALITMGVLVLRLGLRLQSVKTR